jgi:hypothetical protein
MQHLIKYKEWYATIITMLLVVFISVSPIIFTKWSWYDLTNQGFSNIGNAIGGITAPIIGVISGLLIYFTFVKQNQFNRLQITSSNRDTLLHLFKVVKDDINFLVIKGGKNKENEKRYTGINAIIYYTQQIFEDYSAIKEHSLKLELLGNFRMFNEFLSILKEYNTNNEHEIIKKFVLSYYNSILQIVLSDLSSALNEKNVTDNQLVDIKIVVHEIDNSIKSLCN